MGLDTSHDCWSGSYRKFNRWRTWLAKQIGLPLERMQGYCNYYITKEEYDQTERIFTDNMTRYSEPYRSCMNVLEDMIDSRAIPWSIMGDDPITLLLFHSDCDGSIKWYDCKKLSLRLFKIIKNIEHNGWEYEKTKDFALGLIRAYKLKENVVFG